MKTKLKLLLLAMLGLILIPTTNAYELGNQNFWSESWVPPTTTRHKGMCLHYNRDGQMTFDGKFSSYSSISSNNTSCSEGAVLGNFFAPKDYSYPRNEGIYTNGFSYVNSKQNGEGMDMIRTVYQNGEHKTVITTLPSRTAYKRTSNAGIDYMFTQIYFYHNQFILYDPIKEVGLSFLGKMNVVGGAVFANPGTTEDNLRFIDYVRKKAYSATITNTAAWKWLLGTDVSMPRLQAMNWSKSYTMNKGGSSFLPPNFKIDKQGSEGFQYIEDIEFTAPDWNAGKPSNTENNLEAYNNCLSYYGEVHNLARLGDKCSGDGKDEQAMDNFLAIQHWNGEGDAPELKGNSAFLCSVFAKYKKKYKEKHAKDWGKFEQEREEYMFNPDGLVPVNRCQSLKIGEQESGNMWKDLKAFGQNFLSSIGKSIGISNGSQVSKNDYEKDMGEYMAYVRACNHKTYLPTPYDSWKTYIIGYNLFAGADNNENVCKFAKTLEDRINKKYKNIKFNDSYKQALIESYGSGVVNSSGGLNFSKYKEIVNSLPASPYAEEGDAGIFTFLKADYKEGVDTAYSLLSKVHCGRGFGVKEWDYIVYFPLFLLLFILIRGRL